VRCFVPWLADAARSTGYPVVEVAGWRTRGHGGMRVVEGVVGHHTATSHRAAGDYPSLGIVTNGRADLAGPLCNLGLGRSGTVYVVAAGCAYHAGASRWAGFTDLNDEFLGIEAESAGTGGWTPAQLDAYPKLVAALLRYMNRGADRYAGHKDVCLPVGRKIDPVGIDTNWMRERINNPEDEMELSDKVTLFDKSTATVNNVLAGTLERVAGKVIESKRFPGVKDNLAGFISAIDDNVLGVADAVNKLTTAQQHTNAKLDKLIELLTPKQ